jgi:hypothetical protein
MSENFNQLKFKPTAESVDYRPDAAEYLTYATRHLIGPQSRRRVTRSIAVSGYVFEVDRFPSERRRFYAKDYSCPWSAFLAALTEDVQLYSVDELIAAADRLGCPHSTYDVVQAIWAGFWTGTLPVTDIELAVKIESVRAG